MLSKLCKRNGVSVPKLYLNIGQGVRGHVRVYGCLRVYVYAALCVLVYVLKSRSELETAWPGSFLLLLEFCETERDGLYTLTC